MQRFARVDGGLVAEIIEIADGLTLGVDVLHPDLAAQCHSCGPEVEQGWLWDGGQFSPPAAPIPPDLAAVKAARKAEIDAAAEDERLRYITSGAGQAMEYQQAAAEAEAFFAAGHETPPPARTYPMLEASIGIDGDTLADVAGVVLSMHAQWKVIGSAIRAARLAAKQAIDNAGSVAEVEAVTVIWPEPGA